MTPEETAARSLAQGQRYPFDAPDSWWAGSESEPPELPGDWAHKAARGVITDLCDRRGIKRGFDGIDEPVRADIITALADIIRLAAATDSSPAGRT